MAKGEPKRFFRVRGWERYQESHQKGREGAMPWFKFPTSFFDDAGEAEIPDSQRFCWVAVLVMAAKRGNRVPFDAEYIRKRCELKRKPDLSLFMAQGLIEFYDVETTAAERRGDVQEERRGEERRGETEASSPAREPGADPPERPATGSPAAEGGAVAAPAPPNGGPPRATEPPPGDVYRHHGRDYRAGDTLPDGRRVESVEGGVPVILRASAAGAPGELEAAQQALMAEVELAAKALRLPADHALAKFSRTPSGAVIVNPWNCTRLAWIRATTEKLRGARLSVEADTAEASPPAADPDAEFAAYQVIQGHAERYADWCEAKGLPVDHRDSTAAWLAETGLTLTEREGMWLVGERRRVAGRRERAAS